MRHAGIPVSGPVEALELRDAVRQYLDRLDAEIVLLRRMEDIEEPPEGTDEMMSGRLTDRRMERAAARMAFKIAFPTFFSWLRTGAFKNGCHALTWITAGSPKERRPPTAAEAVAVLGGQRD